ncbi:Predicted dehydrogenase [Porphyromonadaceae bacterium KH3R12]|nr:Predicted dehydrogenase [Porphyromonadaceae bacterium KH3R12]
MVRLKGLNMKFPVLLIGLILLAGILCKQLIDTPPSGNPLRIGIDGLSHDHVHGLLNNHKKRTDIQIVGIAEPNKKRAQELADRYGFDMNIVYDDLATMVEQTQPEGVVAFNSIYDHLNTVEVCAPKGIHVMVEKPLAVSTEHARRMAQLARENNIHLLTNYETTWYPTHYKAFEMAVLNQEIGDINKVIINDGHKGPVEIGCSPEFLAWLTDPVLNGGGAVTDFGCYGANLMTWIMQNQEPETVTAVLQTIKPEVYPKVDDQATIILTYPHAQAIIQGSWNWPVERKDLSIYGKEGYVTALNGQDLEYRLNRSVPKKQMKVTKFPLDTKEPFSYFANVIRGDIKVEETDLSSLENNLIVVKILDAAKQSAAEGRTIQFKK